MRTSFFLLFLSALCAGSTAVAEPDVQTRAYLPVPPPRLQVRGFTWQPPAERGWFLEGRNSEVMVLMKYMTGDHLHVIVAQLMPTGQVDDEEGLLEQLSRSANADGSDAVAEHIASAARADAVCVRRIQKFQVDPEFRPAWMTGPVERDDAEFWCRHPSQGREVVSMYYAHVHPPGEASPDFARIADELLGGIRFTPLEWPPEPLP